MHMMGPVGSCNNNEIIHAKVDGEAFLLLTDEQIKNLVKAIEAQMKLIKKRDTLISSSHQVRLVSSSRMPSIQWVLPKM